MCRFFSSRPASSVLPVLILFLASSTAFALDPSKAITQYVHRSWQPEDGLPQTSVQTLTQTPDGYLWIGTANGLARFDGVKFTTYDKTNTPQLRDGSINALRVDRDGTLWIGTSAGVTTYAGGRFHSLGERDGLLVAPTYAILQSRSGEMWIPFPGEICHGRAGHFAREKLPFTGDILTLAEMDGAIWAGGYGGLLRIDGHGIALFTIANGLPDDNVLSLAVRDDALWIGTIRGTAVWKHGRLQREGPPLLRSAEVWSIAFDAEGSEWFGTRAGLIRVHGQTVDAYRSTDGLSNDFVDSLFFDRDGTLWVGTQLGGLNQFHDGAFTTYSMTEGLPSDSVWSIVDDPGVGTWIGAEGGGLMLLSGGKLKRVPVGNGPPVRSATAIARAHDGSLWIGTWDRGLFRQRDGRWTNVTHKDGLADNVVSSLAVSGDTVWAGTLHGLTRIDGGHLTNFGAAEGVPGGYISGLLVDRRGRVWVATDRGTCVMQGARCVSAIGGVALPSSTTYCIHEDQTGRLWFGTRAGLFSLSSAGATRLMTSRDGLPQDKIFQIEQDGDDDFWMTYSRGVLRATAADMERGRITGPLLFARADGMKSAECTYGIDPSSSVAADGSIWFPTTRGAVRLDPVRAKRGHGKPLLHIEEVLVNGQARAVEGALNLAPGAERLEFHYTAPSFVAPERVHFRYRLGGYDRDWIDAGTRRAAFYMNLPPGRYDFRVMAIDGDASAEAALTLVLEPRFTQTRWFEALVIMAIGLVAAMLYAVRLRALKVRYDAVLAERARIAREFHDTLAQGLVGLSYQIDGAIGAIASGQYAASEKVLLHARELSATCLRETRDSLKNLRSRAGTLHDIDLAGALTNAVAQMRESHPCIELKILGAPYRLPDEMEQNILRIAQEALTNAVQHARADRIEVTLTFDESSIALEVSDDGKGPPQGESGPLRFGLVGIQERARAMRGRVSIGGRTGGGTIVRLMMPARSRFFGLGRILEGRRG